jgi:hypothetical protein
VEGVKAPGTRPAPAPEDIMTTTDHGSAHSTTTKTATCDDGWTPTHVTRSLLGWGVVAGPFYVVVSLALALSRSGDGFDLSRHQWSLLENGDLGWVQVTNFVLTGLMLLAYAIGVRRTLGGRAAPVLTAVFGVCLVAAGIFRADPALGFPVGTPDGTGELSGHGVLHFVAAGIGFVAVAASSFVLARHFSGQGERTLARFSRVTGVVFLGGFVCVASGAGSVAANLLFTGAVVLVLAWVTAVAVHLYRAHVR